VRIYGIKRGETVLVRDESVPQIRGGGDRQNILRFRRRAGRAGEDKGGKRTSNGYTNSQAVLISRTSIAGPRTKGGKGRL